MPAAATLFSLAASADSAKVTLFEPGTRISPRGSLVAGADNETVKARAACSIELAFMKRLQR